MKIALVVPGGVDRSGEYRVIPALLALIERLSVRHEVHVFALHQEPEPGAWDLLGARIHNIGRGATRVRALRAILREHRRSPFGLLQSFFSGSCGLIAVSAARVLGIPSAVHVAGGEPVRLRDIHYGGRLTWRGRLQERVVLATASALTAASAPQLELLAGLGAAARRVPLGVDCVRDWPARAPVPRRTDEPARLIHVASLNRVKDQPTLLRALAQLVQERQAFYVDIVGEDTLAGAIQRLARDLGLADRLSFHGFMTQRQLVPLMRAAHVLVVSSRHEAGPVAVLEAAALGVPTVGTAVGHVAEWAPEAALAVPVGDAQSLAAALRHVLTDEVIRLRLARAAWTRAVWEDADYTAGCFEALYEELTSGRRRAPPVAVARR
ncbi:MAG: glycosyltransferase family 4 protein [Gammaproteobacteria bacterium]|nr:glycosyltransferase family 4 protein [Gammaproteobacteria bacterium]